MKMSESKTEGHTRQGFKETKHKVRKAVIFFTFTAQKYVSMFIGQFEKRSSNFCSNYFS